MLPIELKKDKNDLFYLNNPDYLGYMLPFYNNKNLFFEIIGVQEYIVKYYNNDYNKKEQSKNKEMLLQFLNKQEKFDEIDFPIGYYQENDDLKGTIIRYYNSPSLKNIYDSHEIGELTKYYYHDDDMIHNLFKLYLDILNLLEHLYSEKIYYTDVHAGNFVFDQNQVKLIDFDYQYIAFNSHEKDNLRMMIMNYLNLIYIVNKRLEIGNSFLSEEDNFDKTRVLVKELENKVRKEYKNGV